MLYALGIGLGHDPMNEDELPFVYEKNLKVLPTMAAVLGYVGFWARDRDTGIDWVKIVNGEQGVTLHQPLAGQGTVIGRQRIVEVIDKGAGKGALVLSERKVSDKATGELIATVTQTTFCRADGGFGGPPRQAPEPHPIPTRAPDAVCDLGDAPGSGADLSAERRPQSAARRAGGGETSRLSAADHARARQFRHRRPRGAEDDVRLRSQQARVVRLPLLRAGVSRRDAAHRDVARRRGGELPRPRRRARRHRRQQRPRRGEAVSESADLAPIREAVRALCADFPGEYWRALDRERAYPDKFVAALTKAGFLAALIPEEYGGSGLTMSAAVAIMEEIQASGCNGAACHAQMYTMGTVLRHGSAEQKARYLPGIARGELRLQAFGVTEPTSGTDTLSLRTTAVRDGNDSYVVNGQKIWTSRAEHSDLMLLLARTTPREQAKKRTEGLSVFLVDMREVKGKGLTIRPIRTMMNHATTEVFFENMRVPAENLIGVEGEGFRYILSGMNAERILIAAECIGDAKWFIQKATAYAGERVVFGRPIGKNQGVQFPIARAYIDMRAAELMVREAAALYEAGKDCGAEANMAKHLAAEASWAAADMCVQTHGGFGFAEEFDIERKFRETRLYTVAPISTNLVLSYIAEHVLGLPRSY